MEFTKLFFIRVSSVFHPWLKTHPLVRAVLALAFTLLLPIATRAAEPQPKTDVDATTLRRKVMCGYQGWFRCPGDPANEGWRHWSRNSREITPRTLTFEMWPDLSEYDDDEKYAASVFTEADGKPAHLFSSANAKTVERHFRWMQQYGIDGAFLQHFVVELPGGPIQQHHPSRMRVLRNVIDAAGKTGRTWAICYDIAGTPGDRIYDVLTSDWKRLVDDGITKTPRYLHEGGKPVVEIWGFYRNNPGNKMTADLARRLIAFFKAKGPYSAFLIGGGDWNWRRDSEWAKIMFSLDAYSPWNTGNYGTDRSGIKHATTNFWAADKRACEEHGVLWLPVVYPGFAWDNLKRRPSGTTTIPRRGGMFYWEQFHELAKLGIDTAYVAMFDEVDEGTAIFKVTNQPPTQAHFLGYEGLPSDWYLRLTGEGARLLRGDRKDQASLPIVP